MRPTAVARGDMPGPKVYLNWWGDHHNLPKQKGIVTYAVSPFRQRAAHNLIRGYVFNGYRRLSKHFIYWSIPFTLGYGIYTWARSYDKWQNSKAAHVAGHGGH
ncbi:hypothetical protein V8D89_014968 [Ganoderma adspersum]